MISLEETLRTIAHSREQREYVSKHIEDNPHLLPELLDLCMLANDTISCRASRELEILCKKNLRVIFPFLDQLLQIASKAYRDPAVRPMAKIFELLTLGYYHKKSTEIRKYLTREHREKITEICFDWLITDQKVAAQAHSMTSLYLLGTEFDWIHPELKMILENNYNKGSAGYKVRSRGILKNIGS